MRQRSATFERSPLSLSAATPSPAGEELAEKVGGPARQYPPGEIVSPNFAMQSLPNFHGKFVEFQR